MHNDIVIPQYHDKNTIPCMKCQYRSVLTLLFLAGNNTDSKCQIKKLKSDQLYLIGNLHFK